jgi:hypothetical protein
MTVDTENGIINLKRHRKRGIHRAAEECPLAATALNLKRMVNVVGA